MRPTDLETVENEHVQAGAEVRWEPSHRPKVAAPGRRRHFPWRGREMAVPGYWGVLNWNEKSLAFLK